MSTNLALKQIYSDVVYEEPSLVSEKKLSVNKEKAKEWTYYIETLNRTIDCIYEICHREQTVNGCKVSNSNCLLLIKFIDMWLLTIIE